MRFPPPIVRSDTLPENADYSFDGCDASPTCLRCPLPECRYDSLAGYVEERINRRRALVQIYTEAGHEVEEIAATLKVSPRTIHRDRQILRASDSEGPVAGPDPIDIPPKVALSDLPPSWKQRAPLPEIRPGVSRAHVLYERG